MLKRKAGNSYSNFSQSVHVKYVSAYIQRTKVERRKKRDDNDRRGLQTLLQVDMEKKQDSVETHTDAYLEERESVDGSRELDSLYGDEIEAYKETYSWACTNTTNIDVNSEPGPGRADRSQDWKNKADSATKTTK